MSSGGGGMPAMGTSMGVGMLPGFLLSQIFKGQGQQQGGGGGMPSFGGGMFGNPSVGQPFMPMQQQAQGPGPAPQYTASPGAQNQIQSLLSGTGGMSPGASSVQAMSPGMIAARQLIPTTKEGGASQGMDNMYMLGAAPGFLSNVFGVNNRSAIGDIAGALALGRPISDESWRSAGYGPGGALLGG